MLAPASATTVANSRQKQTNLGGEVSGDARSTRKQLCEEADFHSIRAT